MPEVLYDITPTVSPESAVYPGDPRLSRELVTDLARGDSATTSAFYASAHIGAHADAPSHIRIDGKTIDACSIETYLGPCQVIKVSVKKGECVLPEMITVPISAPRVLFCTNTCPDPNEFNEDYAGLDETLANFLHEKGVKLVGVDTPSVDSYNSENLPTHNALVNHNIAILEGLALTQVPAGLYELIALPLKLKDFDASPIRAILRVNNP